MWLIFALICLTGLQLRSHNMLCMKSVPNRTPTSSSEQSAQIDLSPNNHFGRKDFSCVVSNSSFQEYLNVVRQVVMECSQMQCLYEGKRKTLLRLDFGSSFITILQ